MKRYCMENIPQRATCEYADMEIIKQAFCNSKLSDQLSVYMKLTRYGENNNVSSN